MAANKDKMAAAIQLPTGTGNYQQKRDENDSGTESDMSDGEDELHSLYENPVSAVPDASHAVTPDPGSPPMITGAAVFEDSSDSDDEESGYHGFTPDGEFTSLSGYGSDTGIFESTSSGHSAASLMSVSYSLSEEHRGSSVVTYSTPHLAQLPKLMDSACSSSDENEEISELLSQSMAAATVMSSSPPSYSATVSQFVVAKVKPIEIYTAASSPRKRRRPSSGRHVDFEKMQKKSLRDGNRRGTCHNSTRRTRVVRVRSVSNHGGIQSTRTPASSSSSSSSLLDHGAPAPPPYAFRSVAAENIL